MLGRRSLSHRWASSPAPARASALGREALSSATGNASNNTAFGARALQYTTEGTSRSDGSRNTAVGNFALFHNTSGADFAEYLPKLYPDEELEPGDVVGLVEERVTRRIDGVERLLVVSTSPAVLGNASGGEGGLVRATVGLPDVDPLVTLLEGQADLLEAQQEELRALRGRLEELAAEQRGGPD